MELGFAPAENGVPGLNCAWPTAQSASGRVKTRANFGNRYAAMKKPSFVGKSPAKSSRERHQNGAAVESSSPEVTDFDESPQPPRPRASVSRPPRRQRRKHPSFLRIRTLPDSWAAAAILAWMPR